MSITGWLRRFSRRSASPGPKSTSSRSSATTSRASTQFLVSFPKLGETDASNADAWWSSPDGSVAVVVDGASQSFDPSRWSSMLAPHIGEYELLDAAVVAGIAERFRVDTPSDLSWNLEVLEQRGGHATFLRAEVVRSGDRLGLRCAGLGDCMLFAYAADGSQPSTWPFSSLDAFPARPFVVSSVPPHLEETSIVRGNFSVQQGTRIFLMTDAMGRFVRGRLDAGEPTLSFWQPHVRPEAVETRQWVDGLKASGALEDDDITILEVLVDT